MTQIVAFDPGVSNGVAWGALSTRGVLTWMDTLQFGGGAAELSVYLEQGAPIVPNRVVISEKFIPFGIKGSAFTLGSLEPLRGEGVLIAHRWMPDYHKDQAVWRTPDKQYMYGGKNAVEKRKAGKEFLKKQGWYLTGKNVGAPDAEDAISARFHVISYIAQVLRHKPFWDRYFGGGH